MTLPQHRPQAARRFRALGLLCGLSLAAAGCQVVPRQPPLPPPPPEEAPPPPPVEAPPPPPPAEALPGDEERHRVAVLVPLSGENAAVGQSILNAANLALLDTGGARFRITAYDTARPGGAAAAANEALAQGNGLFLGPLLADDVRAAAPAARQANVPIIAFSNDVSVAGEAVYTIGFNPGQSVDRVVGHARARGAQRFGALVPSGTYGERAGAAMIAAVEAAGGRMVGMQNYDRSQSGLAAAAARLNGQGQYDAVLIADAGRIAAQAAPTLRQAAPAPRLLGTELWAAEADLGETAALRGAWFAAPSDALFGQFRQRYRARYGANPFRLASLGYDSVLLAIRVAADWRVGEPFPGRLLAEQTGFVGVDGAFRFGADGVAERALEVREVTAEGTNVVSPAARGFD